MHPRPSWLPLSESHASDVLNTLQQREVRRFRERRSHPALKGLPANENSYYSCNASNDSANRDLNRYLDIGAYDRTIVTLQDGGYINANHVSEFYGTAKWIATQAPLPTTSVAFLKMIREHKIGVVVQLTLDVEAGRRKAHPYFPPEVDATFELDEHWSTTLTAQESIDDLRCIQSTVKIDHDGGDEYLFTHLLYTSWPDQGVPAEEDLDSLLAFLRLVDSKRTSLDSPIVVNCSAGIGRTGSFIALSSLLRYYGFLPDNKLNPERRRTSAEEESVEGDRLPELKDGDPLKEDKVFVEIDKLRDQRPGMVQRDEQVLLIYQVLQDAFEERDK